MAISINSSALSALFSQVDSIQNPEVKRHLLEAQECFKKAEKFGNPAWISYALLDIRCALHEVSSYLHEEEIKEIRKSRKLAHNQHKRTMKRMSDRFTKGRSVDYSSGLIVEEPWFFSAPAKQEVDLEDEFVSHSSFNHPGMDAWGYKITAKDLGCVNSKSKAKWSRSGRTARILSNR
jgi:hypothetical protein